MSAAMQVALEAPPIGAGTGAQKRITKKSRAETTLPKNIETVKAKTAMKAMKAKIATAKAMKAKMATAKAMKAKMATAKPLKMTVECVTSRAYDRARAAAKKTGFSKDEVNAIGRAAYQEALADFHTRDKAVVDAWPEAPDLD